MTCAGNCRLCGLSRDGACKCMVRGGTIVDGFHAKLLLAWEFITTERFFGSVKRQTAFELINLAHQEILAEVANGSTDGRELMTFDRDAVRLRRMADGKLFATRQRMAEAQAGKQEQTRIASHNANRALDGLMARRVAAGNQVT